MGDQDLSNFGCDLLRLVTYTFNTVARVCNRKEHKDRGRATSNVPVDASYPDVGHPDHDRIYLTKASEERSSKSF